MKDNLDLQDSIEMDRVVKIFVVIACTDHMVVSTISAKYAGPGILLFNCSTQLFQCHSTKFFIIIGIFIMWNNHDNLRLALDRSIFVLATLATLASLNFRVWFVG